MKSTGKTPLRMCCVCREMHPKQELIRIVTQKDGSIFPDATGKAPGRGLYVCRRESCIETCCRKRVLNKILHTAVSEEVYESIRRASQQT